MTATTAMSAGAISMWRMDDQADGGGHAGQTIGTAIGVENGDGHVWHPGPYAPSPVPSDERLWPGELPFTAFGQLGVDRLDLRVFDQDQWWVDRTGTPHLLQDMSREYLGNVIEFLVEHRDGYYGDTIRRWFVQSLGDQLLFDEPSGELLASAAGGPALADVGPEEWLESTPLMRKLRRSVAVALAAGAGARGEEALPVVSPGADVGGDEGEQRSGADHRCDERPRARSSNSREMASSTSAPVPPIAATPRRVLR